MALVEVGPGRRRLSRLTLVAGIGLVANACALAPGEFAQTSSEPFILTGANADTGVATPMAPQLAVVTTLDPQSHRPPSVPAPPRVRAETPSAPGQPATTRSASATGGYPDISQPPAEPTSKLLSPEEKARVVAELEALAASQGEPSVADTKKCEEAAADELAPAQRLQRDLNEPQC